MPNVLHLGYVSGCLITDDLGATLGWHTPFKYDKNGDLLHMTALILLKP